MRGFNDLPEAQDLSLHNVASRSSYENFIDLLYNDLDCIFSDMIDGTEHLLPMGETGISWHIWSNLRAKNYDAQLDSDKNGNADISVTQKPFKWIGEAKIFGGKDNYGNPYLYGGYEQLTTRYSKGEANATCGGMLIYIKPRGREETERSVMLNWREYLKGKATEIQDLNFEDCSLNPRCLITSQTHHVSGYPYKVRHMPICLLHLPNDKSGREAKKYQEARESYENFDPHEEDHF